MGFHNVRFPEGLSYGYSGGPQFRTQIHTTDSGYEERVGRWPSPRLSWEAGKELAAPDVSHEVWTFFLARKGNLFAFRFRDQLDFTSKPEDGRGAPTNLDQYLGTGNGTLTLFQLRKAYTSGSETTYRTITHPKVPAASGGAFGDTAQTVVVALDGVNQASGWTVNGTTGVITFTVAPANGVVVTAGFEFDVPVRFGLPDDHLEASFDAYDGVTVAGMPLIEVRGEGIVPETFDYGGTVVIDPMTTSFQASPGMARLYLLNPTATSLSVYMPVPAGLGTGWEVFVLVNQNGTNSITVRDDLGAAIVTLGTSSTKRMGLKDAGGGNVAWVAT